MQEFCQLQKSPQKNSISIRQNDNTLIITYFLYSHFYHIQWDFGYFGDLQYLEIPNFPNIRTLSLAFGKGIANLRKTKSYLRLIIGLSSGKALDK